MAMEPFKNLTEFAARVNRSDVLFGRDLSSAGSDEIMVSVVLNAVLGFSLFLAFSCLRPKIPWCYQPRCSSKHRSQKSTHEPPPPTGFLSWLSHALFLHDDYITEGSGLDGLMLMRFISLCLKFFASCSAAVVVLLPLNYSGTNGIDGFEAASISNVEDGDDRLWFHVFFAFVFAFILYYFLYQLWLEYVRLRHHFILEQHTEGKCMSVFVEEIPLSLRDDDRFFAFFSDIYGSCLRSARIAKNTGRLPHLIEKEKRLHQKLKQAWATFEQESSRRPTHFEKWGLKHVDSISHYTAERDKVISEIKILQSSELAPLNAGFATFRSSYASCVAVTGIHAREPFEMVTRRAPEPRDVRWGSLGVSTTARQVRQVCVWLLMAFFLLFWVVPIALVISLTNIDNLAQRFTGLQPILTAHPTAIGFIKGFLPPVIYLTFMALLPMILRQFASLEGLISHSWIQKSVLSKYFVFEIFNFFVVTMVADSIFYLIALVADQPSIIFPILGYSLPRVSTFFCTYILLRALISFAAQILAIDRLFFWGFLTKFRLSPLTADDKEEAIRPPELDYGAVYPELLLVFVISFSYALLAPVILLFATLFFAIAFVVYRYEILYVYVPTFQTGGEFWPLVYSRMIFGILISQLTLIGVMGLKQSSFQSSVCFLLPIFTLIFHFAVVRRWFYPTSLYLSLHDAAARDRDHGLLHETDEDPYLEPALRQSYTSDLSGIGDNSELKTLE